jgi:hypothetical protein
MRSSAKRSPRRLPQPASPMTIDSSHPERREDHRQSRPPGPRHRPRRQRHRRTFRSDHERLRRYRGKAYKIHLTLNVEELKRSEISANAHRPADRLGHRKALAVPPRHEKAARAGLAEPRSEGSEDPSLRPFGRRRNRPPRSFPLGRFAFADSARRHRLRHATAKTTYGTIGVKVWIYRGEKLSRLNSDKQAKAPEENETFLKPRGRAK